MKTKNMRTISLVTFLCAAFIFGSCNENKKQDGKASVIEASVGSKIALSEEEDEVKLEVKTKEPYGSYLTDSKGRAIYMFTADSKMKSSCYDACAEAWPPVIADTTPTCGDKVNASMVKTIKRKNGKKQITYNGWPLYYFEKDKGEGEVTGQDIKSFGGEWYLISPKGEKIEKVSAKGEKHSHEHEHKH